jgi:hypothetical protein
MQAQRLTASLMVAVVCFVGCGGDSSSDPGGGSAGVGAASGGATAGDAGGSTTAGSGGDQTSGGGAGGVEPAGGTGGEQSGGSGGVCVAPEPNPSCPADGEWFVYRDEFCSIEMPGGAGGWTEYPDPSMCEDIGDGRCYRICEDSSGCPDPCFPYCRDVAWYGGGDHPSWGPSICVACDDSSCAPPWWPL